MRFGVHCSLRHGLAGAADEAHGLGCETLQIFTRSPRVWKMRSPAPDDVALFTKKTKQYGLHPVIVHTPYLPNLATINKELYEKSMTLLKEDIVISEEIGASYLVLHPGSYSEGSTLEVGINNIADAINRILKAVPGKSMVLLENVAGGGRRIGRSFEELKSIIDLIDDQKRIGVCLDSAHAFAGGHDLSTATAVSKVIKDFRDTIGLSYLHMMHLNDSKAAFGTYRDRHEHIGEGSIGMTGFTEIIKAFDPLVQAGILETPKDPPGSDRKNLDTVLTLRAEAKKHPAEN